MEKIKRKFETEPKPETEKKELKDKLKEYTRKLTAFGIITLTSLGISMWALKQMKGNKEFLRYMEHIEGSKRERKALVEKIAIEKQEVKEEVVDIKKTKEMIEKAQYLEGKFGPDIIAFLALTTKKEDQVAKKEKSCPPKIVGFKDLGFKKESLQELWSEKYYPKGSINEEMEAVEYGTSIPQIVLAGTEQKPGKQSVFFASQNEPEKNNPTGREWFLYILDGRFGHELAHINDWESASDLSTEERIEFLYETTKRFESEGSFNEGGSAVDIEARKKLSPQERREPIKEWWASACEVYFITPDIFEKVYPKDAELIEKWLKKQDPDYNFLDASKQKTEFIKSISMNGNN